MWSNKEPTERSVSPKLYTSVHLHGGGGQVGVLVLQSTVQRQTSFLLVISEQRCDGQSVVEAAVRVHRLSAESEKKHMSRLTQFYIFILLLWHLLCFQFSAHIPELLVKNTLGVFVCRVEDDVCGLVHCCREEDIEKCYFFITFSGFISVFQWIEVPTTDFNFLDCFVALVFDFDIDWDRFTMKVELRQNRREILIGSLHSSHFNRVKLKFCCRTSFSIEASRWTGLSDIMKLLQISALGPAPTWDGANWILRMTRRAVSLSGPRRGKEEEMRWGKMKWNKERRDSKAKTLVEVNSLLFNLFIGVVLFLGKISFDLKVNATSLQSTVQLWTADI